MALSNERGQHTAEFALLIGLAAVAAVTMQLIVRRTLQDGMQRASDAMLPPPAAGSQPADTQKALLVTAHNAVDEIGRGSDFHRTTTMHSSVVGHSVNEDVRLQEFGDHQHE